jgi:hypothetical protein
LLWIFLLLPNWQVGTGLDDEENSRLWDHFKMTKDSLGHFQENKPGTPTPPWLRATNHREESPDVWVDHPKNSVVFSV